MKTIIAISAAGLLLAGCGGPKVQTETSKKGADQKVQLVWKQATNQWKVKLNNGPEEDPSTAKTTLPEGTGPTMFVVDISGKSVTFMDPGGLTVWEGSKAAPQQGSPQILGPVVTKNGKLVFWDLNRGPPVRLHYALNLSDGTSVDPIVDNGGGNWLSK